MKTIGNIATAIGAVVSAAYGFVVAVICAAGSVVTGLWKATAEAMAEMMHPTSQILLVPDGWPGPVRTARESV